MPSRWKYQHSSRAIWDPAQLPGNQPLAKRIHARKERESVDRDLLRALDQGWSADPQRTAELLHYAEKVCLDRYAGGRDRLKAAKAIANAQARMVAAEAQAKLADTISRLLELIASGDISGQTAKQMLQVLVPPTGKTRPSRSHRRRKSDTARNESPDDTGTPEELGFDLDLAQYNQLVEERSDAAETRQSADGMDLGSQEFWESRPTSADNATRKWWRRRRGLLETEDQPETE